MANNDTKTEVSFGANTGDLENGMIQAAALIQAAVERMTKKNPYKRLYLKDLLVLRRKKAAFPQELLHCSLTDIPANRPYYKLFNGRSLRRKISLHYRS